MKTLIIKNLTIQVDINKLHGNGVADAQRALDLINLSIQNEPSGLGAQILFSSLDSSDIEIVECDEDEGGEFKHTRSQFDTPEQD